MGKSQSVSKVKNSKKPVILAIIITILLLIIVTAAAGAIVYFDIASQYEDVFLRNTYINGVDASGMTPEEVNDIIVGQQEDYSLTIAFRDGSQETIDGSEFGYSFDALESIQALKEKQQGTDWILEYTDGVTYNYDADVVRSYDEDKLKELVAELPETQEENMTAPTDAYVYLDNYEFKIMGETEGNYFDVEPIQEAAAEKVRDYDETLIVEDLGVYHHPAVYADDESLTSKISELNGYLQANLTYNFTGYSVTLEKTRLINWFGIDENGNYYYDPDLWESNIVGFLYELSGDLDNEPLVWNFNATGIGTIQVEGGTYPRYLDMDAEYARITENLKNGVTGEFTPIVQAANGSSDNSGLGNTYVEIDVTRQHLWAYENGVCWMECDVVTGMNNEERYTPPGVYYVYYKKQDETLRGDQNEDGTYEYESFVSYWMPFNGGIGMHDASWRVSFGGTEYLTNGSHGCVNMPVDQAPKMYDWIDTNIPVIVYYSGGVNLDPVTTTTTDTTATTDTAVTEDQGTAEE